MFKKVNLMEGFLDLMEATTAAGTRLMHAKTAVTVSKWLERAEPSKYGNYASNALVGGYRSIASSLASEAESTRVKDHVLLSEEGHWLSWPAICGVFSDLYEETLKANPDRVKEAILNRNLMMVAIYALLPPGRCKEYRTLLVEHCTETHWDLGRRYKVGGNRWTGNVVKLLLRYSPQLRYHIISYPYTVSPSPLL